MNVIPLNIIRISILLSQCYLVEIKLCTISHEYEFSWIPCLSLPYLPPLVRLAFCFQNVLGHLSLNICLCSQPIWVLWYATSCNQLSQTLYSYSSGFPPLFSLFLPDAASFCVSLEDIQSVLLSELCIPQPLFDLTFPIFSLLPLSFLI